MIRSRSRARRIAKWAGLVVCLVIVASSFTLFETKIGGMKVYLGKSGLLFSFPSGSVIVFTPSELHWFQVRKSLFYVPIWFPFLLAAIPTVILWRRDRKLPPNHCPCGYNLTGNVSGRCPECGAKRES